MELIKNKTEWLRKAELGQSMSGYFEDPKECNSMSVLIRRWNCNEGQKRNIRLHYQMDREVGTITVHACKW